MLLSLFLVSSWTIQVVASFVLVSRRQPSSQAIVSLHAAAASKDDDHPLSATCRLSHAMLKVSSVDKAVEYWTNKGGKV